MPKYTNNWKFIHVFRCFWWYFHSGLSCNSVYILQIDIENYCRFFTGAKKDNVTTRRIKERYNWLGTEKDGKFIRFLWHLQKMETWCGNMENSSEITETPESRSNDVKTIFWKFLIKVMASPALLNSQGFAKHTSISPLKVLFLIHSNGGQEW